MFLIRTLSSWWSSICELPGLKHWKVAKPAIYGELWLRWFEIVSSLNNWTFPWIMLVLKGLWKWCFEAAAGYYGKDQWLLMSYLTLLAGLDSIYVDIFFMVTQLNTVDCVWKYWSDYIQLGCHVYSSTLLNKVWKVVQ